MVLECVYVKCHKGVYPYVYVSCVSFSRPIHGLRTIGLYKKGSLRESNTIHGSSEDECNGSLVERAKGLRVEERLYNCVRWGLG